MFSNVGPWNDYEVTYPVGIRRKHEHSKADDQANALEEEKSNK